MARKTSGPDGISERLHEAIDGLRKDVTRVEIWATALSSFAAPVPAYRPDQRYGLGQPVEAGKISEHDGLKPVENRRAETSE